MFGVYRNQGTVCRCYKCEKYVTLGIVTRSTFCGFSIYSFWLETKIKKDNVLYVGFLVILGLLQASWTKVRTILGDLFSTSSTFLRVNHHLPKSVFFPLYGFPFRSVQPSGVLPIKSVPIIKSPLYIHSSDSVVSMLFFPC